MATPKNERDLVNPTVWVWDTSGTPAWVDKSDTLRCLSLELNAGQIPSRAMFTQVNGRDVTGPIVMKPPGTAGQFKHGMRVMVKKSTTVLFAGWLLKRSDQGQLDKIIWQAFDDRVLMQWIAMRGAIVYDPIDKILRYSPRHPTMFNPNGFWNCTGFVVEGVTYPVFTEVACRTQAYESPTAAYPTDPTVGPYNPWTPRRALKYLSLWSWAHLLSLPGLDATQQSFLSASAFFNIPVADISDMTGYDPSSAPGTADPLDYKLQSLSVQGGSLFNAFGTILGAAGTHTIVIKNDTTSGTTKLGYKNVGYFPLGSGSGNKIIIQRSGQVGDTLSGSVIPDCYDFHFDEDASQICETALVEGDVVRVESSLLWYGGTPSAGSDYSNDITSDIVPAWSYAQEQGFLNCIWGGTPGSPGDKYAKIASVFGDPTTLVACDEVAYPKKIKVGGPEAIQAARDSFPQVFRAWKLNCRSTNMQHLLGLANGDVGGLKGSRPILAEQLQFLIKNLAGGTGVENWMLTHLPIRLRIWDSARSKYYEVPKDIGARVTDDGLIWLDGFAEQAMGTDNCVFQGDLLNYDDYNTGRIVLRKLLINCAFPTDTRLSAIKTVPTYADPTTDPLDNTIRDAFGTGTGKLGRYQDAGQSFRRSIQHGSVPCLSPKYYGGTDGASQIDGTDAIPLSRDLPPGSEVTQATFAAQRMLAQYQCPKRDATFSLIGINTFWGPGDRVDYVQFVSPSGVGDWLYYLRGAIMSVHHDFQAQVSTLNGLFGEYGSTSGG